MTSRANRNGRVMTPSTPRSYGAPTGYSPPARVQTGRPVVGPGTQSQMRAAINADQAAATAGARKFANARVARNTQQMPATNPQRLNLSAMGAAATIKKKQAGDKVTIEQMSR